MATSVSPQQYVSLVQTSAPKLHPDLLYYIRGFFTDDSSDLSIDGLTDFLEPLLTEGADLSVTAVNNLCIELAKLNPQRSLLSDENSNIGIRQLENAIVMKSDMSATLDFSKSNVGDIRHTKSDKGPTASTVDQKKLRAAERKLAAKKEARGGLYTPDQIPTWNPNVKPSIIVNQMKASGNAGNLSKDIRLENFDIAFAGKPILQDATLSLAYGRRYGLVGKNGVGKSTLLRAIAHKELKLPSHLSVLHVEQEIEGDDTTALESVLKADLVRESLLKEEIELTTKIQKVGTTPEDADKAQIKLQIVYQKLEEIESDKAESKASAILSGLGFSTEQQQAATKTFSGGWRMRLALARALFCKPDILLADEVTNYLDFPAVAWLEGYFRKWTATLLVVSHDRSFLDNVTTDILHLHDGKLDYYKGNFTNFASTKAERRRNAIREYEAQLQYRQHLQAFIDRWRYNAKRAPQAQSKLKILEKLPPLIEPSKDEMEGISGEGQDIFFRFNDPEKLSPPILRVDEVTFGYTKDRIILKNVSFDLQMDSKIAVVGPNGAGKSTLIRLMTGQVEPTSGIVQRHGRLRVALFSQHHVEQLELSLSSVQFLQKMYQGTDEEECRRILGRYGIAGTTALQPIGTLSGGQKSRVVFAWLAMGNPHVLVLDEPTNHLDMDSIDALSQALRNFKGGVAVVSHDERFVDSVCSEVWVCEGGTLKRFESQIGHQEGIVAQYKKSLNIEEY